jgi:Na+/H+ antiporter NhaD/arsenite permease-like protein
VPFFWVLETLWEYWLIGMGLLLAVFFVLDTRSFRRLPPDVRREADQHPEEGSVAGMQNIFFLVLILVAVFITDPPFVREALMLVAAAGSYLTTKKKIHRDNDFNFLPIKEVAILFVGIFATMIPALDWLEANAAVLGINTQGQFYWATGFLSSFLDNAPTYLNFLSAQFGLFVTPEVVHSMQALVQAKAGIASSLPAGVAPDILAAYQTLLRHHYDLVAAGAVPVSDIGVCYIIANHPLHLEAISISAVFFGACTYIGNGPNFMVKSIAEQAGATCPSFFGYIFRYTIPVLLPIFAFIWFILFRG